MGSMRLIAGLTFSLLGAALTCSLPAQGFAQASQSWDAYIGTATKPDERVSACTTIIDARSESGKKLAAAYCNRGHGLTEKRELDRALADLDEAIRLDPTPALSPTAAVSTPSSATSIAPWPTMTRRSASIRPSRWPTTTAATPGAA